MGIELSLEKQSQSQGIMMNTADNLEDNIKQKCPECNLMFTEMTESGVCRICVYKKHSEKREKEEFQERLIEKLGAKGQRDFTFDQFDKLPENLSAYESCFNFDEKLENLYLWGNVGSGKSHLAYAIVRKYLDSHTYSSNVTIIKPPEIMRLFRGVEASAEKEMMNTLVERDILVIDDLGIGRATEFANQILYEIIDKRLMNLKNGLIITSNLSLADFAKKIEDKRLPDRLVGMCKFEQVSVKKSWRMIKK